MNYLIAIFFLTQGSYSAEFDCLDLHLQPIVDHTSIQSPLEDFNFRDTLPRTEIAKEQWQTCCGSYGPCALPYPKVNFPNKDVKLEWSKIRVIEAAKKLIGTPYGHYHIPEMGGLDCSNFTALVYNYALGIRFSSKVKRQALEAGRLLLAPEKLEAGDLVFLYKKDSQEFSHAVIYIDENHIIDSTGPGVRVRAFTGWYQDRFAWARRLI